MVAKTERAEIRTGEREKVTEIVDTPVHKSDGPLAAVLLASGLGTTALGILTTLAEASESVKEHLALDDGVGPLAGKTIYATAIFVIAWVILHALLRGRDGLLRQATIAFVVLTLLGFLGTFPIFFQAFAPE